MTFFLNLKPVIFTHYVDASNLIIYNPLNMSDQKQSIKPIPRQSGFKSKHLDLWLLSYLYPVDGAFTDIRLLFDLYLLNSPDPDPRIKNATIFMHSVKKFRPKYFKFGQKTVGPNLYYGIKDFEFRYDIKPL